MVASEVPLTGPLAALGIDVLSEQVYRLCLRRPGLTVESLCDIVGRPLDDVERDIAALVDHRLVSLSDETVFPEPPEFALGRLLHQHGRRLAEAEDALGQARDEVNTYVAEHLVGQRAEWQPVAVDVIPASDLADVMVTLIATTTGEMLFLRPDQWFLPTGLRVDVAVTAEMDSGRTSRVIYPARVTESLPENIQTRAGAGEQVRVLPDVPTRLAVLGTEAAVLPEVWGSPAGSRLLIRQPAIIAACIAYFEELWTHAVTAPGFGSVLGTGGRQQLLEMLAGGAKDEQIARTMGMSLRTVRRRIASVLAELGVDSRFQAGMEAVRRGWL
jgi:DNA-binding CsgD family transcriptional regulator